MLFDCLQLVICIVAEENEVLTGAAGLLVGEGVKYANWVVAIFPFLQKRRVEWKVV